jgi:peroxiredoxin
MKSLFTVLAVAALLFTSVAHADIETGKAAPDYTFKDIAGAEHSIAKFKGKTVILEWTNPGCPFVKKFYDHGDMPKIQEKALANPDTVWISINSSAEGKEGHLTNESAAKWVADNSSKTNAYVLDPTGAFGKLYGAKTTPHMYVINKEGTLVYQGAIDSIKSADAADIAKANNYVLKALDALNAGSTPEVGSTASYGCSVKYAD